MRDNTNTYAELLNDTVEAINVADNTTSKEILVSFALKAATDSEFLERLINDPNN